ncbi:MAG: type III-A CRISPR-associated RAMP protein Csm5 [Cyanothece sp. SIO2G6]|nr:type III-A CRISPR-associated RAMP protein Csm5 [Cyanothece sp. SIO2G6]
MIRNGLGEIYIPGSSIKGAIRTAIAYHLLQREDTFKVPHKARVSEIEKILRNKIRKYDELDNPRRSRQNPFSEYQKGKMDNFFMEEIFNGYDLEYQGKIVKSASHANRDFMRAVHITDSNSLVHDAEKSINSSRVVEVIVVSRDQNWKAKYRTSAYVELVENIEAEFNITVDYDMLSWFQHRQGMKIPFKDIGELLDICQSFAQKQWLCEMDYWSRIQNNPKAKCRGEIVNLEFDDLKKMLYGNKCCPYALRVGWASGLLGTTISSLLEDDLATQLRDRCHHNNAAPEFGAPKSRRLIANRDRHLTSPLGWVKFEVMD